MHNLHPAVTDGTFYWVKRRTFTASRMISRLFSTLDVWQLACMGLRLNSKQWFEGLGAWLKVKLTISNLESG